MKPQYAADICPSKSLSPLGPGKPLISWEKGNIPPSSPSPQGAALSPLPTSQPPVTETNQTHLVSMPKCRSQPWSAQIVLLGPAQLWHLPAPKTSAVCPQLRQNAGAQHCRANPSNGDSASHQINNSSRFPKSLTEFGYFAMKHSHVLGEQHRDPQCPGGFQAPASTGCGRRNQNSCLASSTKANRASAPAPREGWGALVGWGAEGAASASPGNRAAPAPWCQVQTTCDPALANYVFIPKQRTNLLFPKSHITRDYTTIKWSFPIATLRDQDQPRNLVHKHGQVKHSLKPKILPLPPPPPPLFL